MLKSVAMFAIVSIGLLSSCTDRSPPREGANVDVFAVMPNFTSAVVVLPLGGEMDLHFGIQDCEVYRASSEQENWKLLFKPASYPLPQQCVRERLEYDGDYIQIEIGTQALGAGGCCTNYAAYRSRDGKNWEIRPATSISEWQTLAEQP